ncbi:hypothetical protein BGZ97_005556, partial [Linnemannia gamsii]
VTSLPALAEQTTILATTTTTTPATTTTSRIDSTLDHAPLQVLATLTLIDNTIPPKETMW